MKTLSKLKIFFIIAATSLVLFLLAFYYYKSESEQIVKEKHEFLDAVTNIKLEQIVEWRNERISEAEFFPTIGRVIKYTVALNENKNNKEAQNYFLSTLLQFNANSYDENIFITNVKGEILFTLDSTFNTIDQARVEEIKYAVKKDSTIIGEFYFYETNKTIRFNIISVIKDNYGIPIGVFVQHVNPNKTFYPLIQKWPTLSKTAETLIIKKEKDHVVYLNELRHKKNSALTLKIPLTQKEVVAVKAVLGSSGIIEGKDYRGKDVLADIKTIPGTDWFMVSKVDKDELYTELFYRAGIIFLVALITILLITIAALYIYKLRQSSTYKNLFLKEKELAETQEEYRTALYSIGDAVITTDTQGKIKQMNSVAETLTGWKEIEVKGKSLSGVFNVINEETNTAIENPVNRVLRDRTVVGLANHTMLISKKGNKIPIADSGSPIKNSDGKITGVVLVFRDQTEEREKEKALQESNEKFSKIFKHSSDSISLTQLSTGKLFELNNGFEKMFGYTREEAYGKTTIELGLWANQDDRIKILEMIRLNGYVKNFEAAGIQKNGNQIIALISGEIVDLNNEKFLLLSLKDITERKKFEEALKASEEKYRKMTLNSPMGMHFYELKANNDLIFIDSNPAADKILGIDHSLLYGKTIEQAFPQLSKTEVPQRYCEAASRGIFWSTEQITYKDDKIEGAFEVKAYQTKPNKMVAVFADITQRKRAEEELKASEEKFTKAFYTSPDSININRLSDGMCITVNDGFVKMTGYSVAEVIGKSSYEINIWADIEDRNKLVAELKERGIVENLEARFRLKNGEIKNGLMSASILELNGEKHILSITRDISERKKAEEIIKSSEANLNSLINNRNESIWSIDKDYNFIIINDFFSEAYFNTYNQKLTKGINAVEILLPELKAFWKPKYDAALSGRKIEFEFSYELNNEPQYIQVFLNPIMADGIISGVSALSVDITERKRSEEILKTSESKLNESQRVAQLGHYDFDVLTGTWTCSQALGDLFGIDQSFNHDITGWSELIHPDDRELMLDYFLNHVIKEKNRFDKEYRIIRRSDKKERWVHGLGDLEFGINGEPIKMFGTIQDITRNKDAENAIRMFQFVSDNAPDAVFWMKSDAHFYYVNDQACKSLGFTREELMKLSLFDIDPVFPPEAWNKSWNSFHNKEIETEQLESFHKRKDGSVFPVEVIAQQYWFHDKDLHVAFVRDITQRKKSEERIVQTKIQFQKLIEHAPDGIVQITADGEFKYVSPSAKRIFGYPLEKRIEVSHDSLTHPEDLPKVLKTLEDLIKNPTLNPSIQYRFKNNNGNWIWIESTFTNLLSEPSVEGIVINFRDVTKSKRQEEALKENEERLRLSLKATKQGLYDLNVQTGEAVVNDEYALMLGYDPKTFVENYTFWTGRLHPEDKGIATNAYLDYIEGKSSEFKIEFRHRTKNNEWKWILLLGKIVEYDLNGKALRMLGTNTDITSLKDVEYALRESEERYRIFFENNDAIILMIDPDNGNIIFANDSASKFYGWKKDELLGMNINQINTLSPEEIKIRITDARQRKQNYLIFTHRLANGNIRDVEVYQSKLNLDNKEIYSIIVNDITDRRNAEKALKVSEELYRTLINTSPDAVSVANVEGKITFVSNKSLQLYGHSSIEEVIGHSLFEWVAPQDHEKAGNNFKSLMGGKVQTDKEFLLVKKDGTIFFGEISAATIYSTDGRPNGIILVTRDISDRKKTEESIRKLSLAVEQSPATIVITDVKGKIEYVNPKFLEVTGYSIEEVKGENPRILKSGMMSAQDYKQMWDDLVAGKEWHGEFHNKKKNGEYYWESASISPIFNNKGDITNFLAIKQDITEQKRMTSELVEAKEKAEEMNKVKTYFFANMSHELRTPFVGIMGFSELLAETLINPEEKKYAEQILKSSKRLTDTLNKILNVAKIEFNGIEISISDLNVDKTVGEIANLYTQSAKVNNTELITDLKFGSSKIRSDKELLEEILDNLISNAVKYTKNGRVVISSEKIQEDEKVYLTLKVADTGVGIPEEMQKVVWREFRQASEGFNRSFEGTGLGLTITKKYVERLNGIISLESEEGKGTLFTIKLPVTLASKDKVKTEKLIKHTTKVDTISKKPKYKVLYVEDDAIALQYINIVLKSLCDIETAFTAKSALDLIIKNQYDVLMLDINLGRGMDGLQLMQEIKKIEHYKNIPFVAVTAYAAESDKAEFLAKGFSHYISKPFTSNELRNLLTKILEQLD